MREREIESALVKAVKKRSGYALKLISPNVNGVPDRIILLADGKIGFVETKKPGGKLRVLQEKRKRQLEELGFLVFCLDSKEEIGGVLDAIQAS